MNDEQKIKQQLQGIKDLYINVLIYSVVAIICILIWISMGFGVFWPIWVIIAFCVTSIIQGIRVGMICKIVEYIPFLKPDWEKNQMELLNKDNSGIDVGDDKKLV
jgi:hypothetical protein